MYCVALTLTCAVLLILRFDVFDTFASILLNVTLSVVPTDCPILIISFVIDTPVPDIRDVPPPPKVDGSVHVQPFPVEVNMYPDVPAPAVT
jgi:hypothetical protein